MVWRVYIYIFLPNFPNSLYVFVCFFLHLKTVELLEHKICGANGLRLFNNHIISFRTWLSLCIVNIYVLIIRSMPQTCWISLPDIIIFSFFLFFVFCYQLITQSMPQTWISLFIHHKIKCHRPELLWYQGFVLKEFNCNSFDNIMLIWIHVTNPTHFL